MRRPCDRGQIPCGCPFQESRTVTGSVHFMGDRLLNTAEAAQELGIAVASLYDWLAQSDVGSFEIRGQSMTIDYFQGGRRGQGRIQIEAAEIERLKEAMRVRPQPKRKRRRPIKPMSYPGINVPLGRPDD